MKKLQMSDRFLKKDFEQISVKQFVSSSCHQLTSDVL